MTQSTLHYPAPTNRANGEISLEELRSLLCKIEPALRGSAVYKRMLDNLQESLSDVPGGAPFLLKALAREVIRLSAQELQPVFATTSDRPDGSSSQVSASATADIVTRENAQPISSLGLPTDAEKLELPLPNQAVALEESADAGLADPLPVAQQHQDTNQQPGRFVRKRPRLTKAELETQTAIAAWEQRLVQIGNELQEIRLARSISRDHLSQQTRVPAYQIKALEMGDIEHLPEDVYVRGFIRALGNALGLDGANLSASLPNPNPSQTIVPSWYQSNRAANNSFHLRPIHIYAGYAALMAGASGALLWTSYRSSATAFTQPEIIGESQSPMYQNAVSKTQSTHTPGVKAGARGAIAGPDIAPPEQLMF